MSAPLVVLVERSGTVESEHLIDVAVVDTDGGVVAAAGEHDRIAAFRSSAKPIQARAALAAGWKPANDVALAIACASHNAEPAHVDAVRAVLAGAGLDESALACPPDAPRSTEEALRAGERKSILHNCSGKHAGMLAACVAAGWPVDGYLDPAHPLQRAIADRMRAAIGDTQILVDGCGAPTFTAPLPAFARAFMRIDDGGPETMAMRAHPFLVGGTDRLDTDLMRATPGLVAKGGAEGLLCVSVAGCGIALKSRDGSPRANGPAVLHVLAALDLIDVNDPTLSIHRTPPVLGGGRPVGTMHVDGSLTRR